MSKEDREDLVLLRQLYHALINCTVPGGADRIILYQTKRFQKLFFRAMHRFERWGKAFRRVHDTSPADERHHQVMAERGLA